jgi:carboxypeptidase family protein
MRASLGLWLCGLGLAGPLAAQGVLTGTVREDSSGRPLAGVEVLLEKSALKTTTDAAGRYVLGPLPGGLHTALFRFVGYRPVRMFVRPVEDTVWASPVLVAGNVQLDPIVVTAAEPRGVGVEGFEERRRLGFGKFFDATEIRRKEHLRLGHLLGGSGQHVYAVSPKRAGPQGEPCFMSIYLDGTLLYRSPGPPGMSSTDIDPDPLDLNTIELATLEAVEWYGSAAAVPMEYGGASAACGVILLWSRRGL